MSESKQNKSSDFQSKDEASEYLVKKSQEKVLKDQWAKELDQLPDVPTEEVGKRRRLNIRRIAAVAACFIILLGTFYWFTQREDTLPQMAQKMIEETNFILVAASDTRGLESRTDEDFEAEFQKEISQAMEKKDYGSALGLFVSKEKRGRLTNDEKFHYALSLARVTNADNYKAIRLLDDVIIQKENYYDEALWLQALLYLKIDDPYQSKILLNKLINTSNYQITNSTALLERIAD